ncbi:hypothetical protein [Kangiella shandongensis]|uniref:hypothetical protein n=1 Tax=Kangiella shandongensis TaxID=2763258 RepID=UPI001CBDF2DB|nr:hypothetical protein [Kangiella shandongensis]
MTKSNLKNISIIITGSLLLWACSSAPKKQTPVAQKTPVKKEKTYEHANIGANNYMKVPSSWKLKQNIMPKGYVSYTIKNKNVHLVISGYKAKRSTFNINKSKKDLASVTILYRTGSKLKRKTYKQINDNHKIGGYTHHTCHNGAKCYQVFPLSNWRSVIAADFFAGGMKYTFTAGVDDLKGSHAEDILQAINSIKGKHSVELTQN